MRRRTTVFWSPLQMRSGWTLARTWASGISARISMIGSRCSRSEPAGRSSASQRLALPTSASTGAAPTWGRRTMVGAVRAGSSHRSAPAPPMRRSAVSTTVKATALAGSGMTANRAPSIAWTDGGSTPSGRANE